MAGSRVKNGTLTRITVSITDEAGEAVLELLEEFFGQPASLYTSAKTRRTVASVYLKKASDWSRRREAALRERLAWLRECGMEVGSGRISMVKVPREDWAESWKRHCKAISIGRALLIKPSWIRRTAKPGQAVVVLDPGLSFGTGQHPTTHFCLEQLVAARKPETTASFLDMGTGSGILAIAAVKLGYRPVEGFDFDPAAIRVARANALENGVATRWRPRLQNLTQLPLKPVRQFDVVGANLICDLLVAELRRIVARVKPTGRLILAGILKSQFKTIVRTYGECGMTLLARAAVGEWESGAFAWK